MAPFRKFKHRDDGLRAAKNVWTCRGCDAVRSGNTKPAPRERCARCVELHGFFRHASEHEMIRWQQLRLMQRGGEIEQLAHQPRFDLTVNGAHVTTYVADAAFIDRRSRKYIVEDVKPAGDFMTETAKLKIALFNAIYRPNGVSVTLVKNHRK